MLLKLFINDARKKERKKKKEEVLSKAVYVQGVDIRLHFKNSSTLFLVSLYTRGGIQLWILGKFLPTRMLTAPPPLLLSHACPNFPVLVHTLFTQDLDKSWQVKVELTFDRNFLIIFFNLIDRSFKCCISVSRVIWFKFQVNYSFAKKRM